MNFDKKVFEEILGFAPDFSNKEDVQSMHSIWYLLESFNATTYVFDFDLDEYFEITEEGIKNTHYILDLNNGHYLREDSLTDYGKTVVKSINESLNETKKIDKRFLLNGIAILTYVRNHIEYRDYTAYGIINNIAPKFSYIINEIDNAKKLIDEKIEQKQQSNNL